MIKVTTLSLQVSSGRSARELFRVLCGIDDLGIRAGGRPCGWGWPRSCFRSADVRAGQLGSGHNGVVGAGVNPRARGKPEYDGIAGLEVGDSRRAQLQE